MDINSKILFSILIASMLLVSSANAIGVKQELDTGNYILENTYNYESKIIEVYTLESAHPYTNNYDNTWTITRSGATAIRVHFSLLDTENGYDYVTIYDASNVQIARYGGTYSDTWIPWVTGDTVKIRLSTDSSVVRNGFIIDQIDIGGAGGGGTGSSAIASSKSWVRGGYDLSRNHYYPYPTNASISMGDIQEAWTLPNRATALTEDLNNDGLLEVIATDGNAIRAFDSVGTELWSASTTSTLNLISDLTGDGIPEIVTSERSGSTLNIHIFSNTGSFVKTISKAGGSDSSISVVAASDFDGDGNIELLVHQNAGYSRDPRGVSLFDYTTGTELWYYDVGPAGDEAYGDIDEDGVLDIVRGGGTWHNGASGSGVGGTATSTTDSYLYSIAFNAINGVEKFTVGYTLDGQYHGYIAHAIVDLNHDGNNNILAFEGHDPTYYPGTSQIHLMDNTGSIYDTYNGPSNVHWMSEFAIADLNNDNLDEIVVVGTDGILRILNSNLDLVASTTSISTNAYIPMINDIDGDGNNEILVPDIDLDKVWIFDGSLNELGYFDVTDPTSIVISDLNNDGTNEIIVSGITTKVFSAAGGSLTSQINQIYTNAYPQISAFVTVSDLTSNPISGLTTSNCQLTEDGVTETTTVAPVSSTGTAASIAMTLDYSGSMSSSDIANAKSGASTFVNSMNTGDRASIIKFGKNVEIAQSFTSDITTLQNSINSPTSVGSTATSLYDSIYQSVELLRLEGGRKAVIAFTDGGSNDDVHTLTETINFAITNNVPVYTIGLGSANTAVLQRIATDTGGQYFYAPTNAELAAIYSSISNQINNQYEIVYTTHNSALDGISRTVSVTCSSGGLSGTDISTYTAPYSSSTTINIGDATTGINSTVDVPITLSDASSIAASAVRIVFDPSVVNVDSVATGDFGTPVINIDNTNGFVYVATSRSTAVGVNNAILATVTFRGVAGGSSNLHIEAPTVSPVSGVVSIPTTNDGTLTVSSCGGLVGDMNGNGMIDVGDSTLILRRVVGTYAPSVSPTMNHATTKQVVASDAAIAISDYTTSAGSNTNVPVTIDNANGVAGASLKVIFDPAIISVQSVSTGDFGMPTYNIDNSNGFVSIAVSTPTGVASTTATIANIVFTANSGGTTTLGINEPTLADVAGTISSPLVNGGSISVSMTAGSVGDINSDGALTSLDALMVLQMASGNIPVNPAADVNGDGSVTSLDALMILQASVGAIVL